MAYFQLHGRKLVTFRKLEGQNVGLDLGPATLYPDLIFCHVARFGVKFHLASSFPLKLLADMSLV
jgi:hypothetical protein